jgi:hypothetical protein
VLRDLNFKKEDVIHEHAAGAARGTGTSIKANPSRGGDAKPRVSLDEIALATDEGKMRRSVSLLCHMLPLLVLFASLSWPTTIQAKETERDISALFQRFYNANGA